MKEVTGGCLCGSLRYTLKAAPEKAVLCHCTHCQKTTGSAFSVNALVAESDIAIQGEMSSYGDLGEGAPVARHFCPKCGSSICSRPAARPGMVVLKVGSLDDTKMVSAIAAQIWVRSKQPWVNLATDAPSFEKGR